MSARYGMPPKATHTMAPGRRSFTDNPRVHSKGGANMERDGFQPSDPRQPSQPATQFRDDVPPSLPARHVGGPARPHVETVGHMPDGSGRFSRGTRPNGDASLHGNAVFNRPPLEPVGQAHSASGGQFGEPQKRPPAVKPNTAKAHPASLNGDSDRRKEYLGGRGPIGGPKA